MTVAELTELWNKAFENAESAAALLEFVRVVDELPKAKIYELVGGVWVEVKD